MALYPFSFSYCRSIRQLFINFSWTPNATSSVLFKFVPVSSVNILTYPTNNLSLPCCSSIQSTWISWLAITWRCINQYDLQNRLTEWREQGTIFRPLHYLKRFDILFLFDNTTCASSTSTVPYGRIKCSFQTVVFTCQTCFPKVFVRHCSQPLPHGKTCSLTLSSHIFCANIHKVWTYVKDAVDAG